jgi:hypothetical protein
VPDDEERNLTGECGDSFINNYLSMWKRGKITLTKNERKESSNEHCILYLNPILSVLHSFYLILICLT